MARGLAKVLRDVESLKWDNRGNSQQRHWDSIQPGFFIRVYPSPADRRETGMRSFFVKFTLNGKQIVKKIGNWPEFELDEARMIAARWRRAARDGLRPNHSGRMTMNDLWMEIVRGGRQYPLNEKSPMYI